MRKFLTTEGTDGILAFFTGGIPASIVGYSFFDSVVFPILMTVITGLIGGFSALIGKEIYKKTLGKKFKK